MAVTTILVEAEVDLGDIEDDDLVREIKSRGYEVARGMPVDWNPRHLLTLLDRGREQDALRALRQYCEAAR